MIEECITVAIEKFVWHPEFVERARFGFAHKIFEPRLPVLCSFFPSERLATWVGDSTRVPVSRTHVAEPEHQLQSAG